MELPISPIQPSSSWPFFLSSPLLFPTYVIPQNYVHWTETPESHLFSADLPGVRKEEIRVEVEDSRYLIIRTERDEGSTEPERNFIRKFRLPEMIDIDAISAGYEDGVLTVRVPRYFTSRRLRIDPSDLAAMDHLLAPAA